MRKLITVGIVLGVLAAAGWWLVEGSVPISGERSHDFGPVEVPGVVQLKHTYVLTNRSRSPISIAAIRPGCGCTTVDFPKDAIAPGASFEIPIVLNLTAAGEKKTKLTMLLDGIEEPVRLFVRAVGLKPWSAEAVDPFFIPEPGMPSFFAVHVARQGGEGDVPPVPEIRGPEVLGLEFDRWETLYLADADENAPSRWHAVFRANWDGESDPTGDIEVDVAPGITVALRVQLPREPTSLELPSADGFSVPGFRFPAGNSDAGPLLNPSEKEPESESD